MYLDQDSRTMITRTANQETFAISKTLSLRAEVLLLSIITIFGVIGLCCCLGLSDVSEGLSADIQHTDNTEIAHDRQIET